MLEERVEQWKRDYINQGREEGREEGRKEGREEGREEARAEIRADIVHLLINVLQHRFETLPPSLGAYLATVSDVDVLFRLHEQALWADSLQEFMD